MPKYDKLILSEQANGHSLNFFIMNPILSDSLALKGGTAINLTIFNLPCLSVDVDLDYTINNTRDEMLEERKIITDNIKRYMFAERYELSNKSKNNKR